MRNFAKASGLGVPVLRVCPDERAAALKAKTAAAGLSLEAWLKQLAGTEEKPAVNRPLQTAAESSFALMSRPLLTLRRQETLRVPAQD
jgi:hypothetical protein